MLQLGHGDLPVETPIECPKTHTLDEASIGPRRFTRGNGRGEETVFNRFRASIGPRSFTRGNALMSRWKPCPKPRLQLGHGDLPVETQNPNVDPEQRTAASIGPRRFTRGNLCLWLRNEFLDISFNWATEIYPWKPITFFYNYYPGDLLQLGHGDLPVETP